MKSRPILLPRRLAEEIRSLNSAQKRAVLNDSHTVVLAGPGSGKTRLLVAKASYLAATEVAEPQRVACLTFATKAVEEIRGRLRSLDPASGRSVTCATVHAFCLKEILIPFAKIAGYPPVTAQSVVDEDKQFSLRVRAYDEASLADDPRWNDSRDIACRRLIYAGEDPSRYHSQVVAAARIYDGLLMRDGLLDFEAMVGRSLEILRNRDSIRRLVSSRFPWLVVDEYQDLGPVLHGIVSTLREAGSRIFAVGDPDQSIHGFTGSDPKYLIELSQDSSFHTEPLRINYRSGRVLVDAASRVLGVERGYEAHDQEDPGLLDHQVISGGIQQHASRVVQVAADLISNGIAPHEISVLYPRNRRKAPLGDWIMSALNAASLPVTTERRQTWPRARITSFLQKIAHWQLANSKGSARVTAARFEELAEDYTALRAISWHQTAQRLSARVDLWNAITSSNVSNGDVPTWLADLDRKLGLTRLVSRDPEAQEISALRQLLSSHWSGYSVVDFCEDVETAGKITLTTYHSSKGRQWSYVILPGLQEGIVPDWPLDYGRPYLPGPMQVAAERRLFYVALTRAKRAAILIYSRGIVSDIPIHHISPSRFISTLPGFAE